MKKNNPMTEENISNDWQRTAPYVISVTHKPSFFQRLFFKFIRRENLTYWQDRFGKYVTLLDGNNVSHLPNFGNHRRIKIQMENGNMAYRQFLGTVHSNPFTIGQMFQFSRTAQQVGQTISFTDFELHGSSTQYPQTPIINPYQNQSENSKLDFHNQPKIDGNSRMRFKLLCGVSVNLQLFKTNQLIVDLPRKIQ